MNTSFSFRARAVAALALVVAATVSACSPSGGLRTTPTAVPDSVVAAAITVERSLAPSAPTDAASATLVIAVPPFAAALGDTLYGPLGFALADFVAVDLARSGRLTVVERVRLDAVLRELELARTGAVDELSAPRAGRLLQAQQVVIGTIRPERGDDLVMDLRLADVEAGSLRGGVRGAASLDDVFAAQKAIVFRLFDALSITLTPAERATIEGQPTRSLAALLAYGRGRQNELLGDYRAAAREYQKAANQDQGFQAALGRLQIVTRLDPLAARDGIRAAEQQRIGTGTLGPDAESIARDFPIGVPNQRGTGQMQARSPLGTAGLVIDRINRPLDQIVVTPAPGPTNPTPTQASSVVRVPIIIVRP